MKPLFALGIILLSGLYAFAQPVGTAVIVTAKSNIVYRGTIVEEVKDLYIRVRTEDKGTAMLSYNLIQCIIGSKGDTLFTSQQGKNSYRNIDSKSTPHAEPLTGVPHDTLFTNLPYTADWDKAMLINGKDTTLVKLERKEDYMLGSGSTDLAYRDGKRGKLHANDMEKMVIFEKNGEETWYYTFNGKQMYKLQVDGKCQLFYCRELGPANKDPRVDTYYDAPKPGHLYHDVYCAYYKGDLYRLRSGNGDGLDMFPAADFKKKCRKLLSECPELVKKIENGTYGQNNLEMIVNEFNACLK